MDTLFGDAAERLFSQTCTPAVLRAAEQGVAPSAAWQACEDAGFADALVPDSAGGAGLTLADVLPLALAAGRHLAPSPVAHTLLARAWLSHAAYPLPVGSITIAAFGVRAGTQGFEGVTVPWARTANHVLAQIGNDVWLLPMADAQLHSNGPHGSLDADVQWARSAGQRIVRASHLPRLLDLAAVGYTALMAGAMDRILEYTLDYANQRAQFGKPIGKFQAIQQQLSIMAEQVWAVRMAAQLAFQGDDWVPRPRLAALGKARASQAASIVADIAHAVHGAIGVTEEYDLQLYTRRIREWRLAAGSESFWHARIGADALAADTDALTYLRTQLFA